MNAGIIGLGFVGNAMLASFQRKNINTLNYDKFSSCDNTLKDLLETDLVFLCLPTPYDSSLNQYDKSAIQETCEYLNERKYSGSVVIKSTVEPTTCQKLSDQYVSLSIIHNPEFLTARTAKEDYHNQKHIVLGKTRSCTDDAYNRVVDFHSLHYPWAQISKCKSIESESAKLFANSFYAVKVQFFTEILRANGYYCSNNSKQDYNMEMSPLAWDESNKDTIVIQLGDLLKTIGSFGASDLVSAA